MKRPWLNHRRALLIVVVLLCLSSLLPTRWANAISARPRGLAYALVVPVIEPLKHLGDMIRPGEQTRLELGEQVEMETNYRSMLVYVRQLEGELSEAREQIAQLSQIRQHLSLGGAASVPASATWPSGTQTLVISRGSRQGLYEGLMVADGFNLVGRLSHVGALNATVRLITAPKTHMQARIVPAEPGPASRELFVHLSIDEDGRSFVDRIDVDAPVEVGDLAHLADEDWPIEARGMVIGRVEAIERDPTDPLARRQLIVTPLRSLTQLSRVIVVVPRED